MNSFKVGDKIHLKDDPNQKRVVTKIVSDRLIDCSYDNGTKTMFGVGAWQYSLDLSPTEEAVRLLTEAGFFVANSPDKAVEILVRDGYTVTPPKPKKNGSVAIYENRYGSIMMAPKDGYDNWPYKSESSLLAIVPWTEGMGLEDKPFVGGPV